jgi:hypothetical protein
MVSHTIRVLLTGLRLRQRLHPRHPHPLPLHEAETLGMLPPLLFVSWYRKYLCSNASCIPCVTLDNLDLIPYILTPYSL